MRTLMTFATACACVAMVACSPSEAPKKEEPKKVARNEKAPELFRVNLDTTKGPVIVEIYRDWAPTGADHFYSLVQTGFFDGARFFRVVRNFIVQFGISGDPKTNRLWANANLPDDPVKEHNVKGTLTFATAGPNTRSTQLFINLRDNRALDKQGFAPIGKVVEGMNAVESLYNSYGEMPSRGGQGPDPTQIEIQGNEYLANRFPRLDYIKKATVQ
jgi:peptidyl-prolyl cis-trans isomerase A (cyclophilin A)